MENFQQESITHNFKSTFNDCKQNHANTYEIPRASNDNVNIRLENSHQTSNAVKENFISILKTDDLAVSDKRVIFKSNGNIEFPSKPAIMETERSIDSINDNEEKETTITPNVDIDNLPKVLLKPEIINCELFASDIKCNPGSEKMHEDCNSNCQNGYLPPKDLYTNISYFVECEDDKKFTNDAVELNTDSLQMSEEIGDINLNNGSSQSTQLEISMMNDDSKPNTDFLNKLTILDGRKTESPNELSIDLVKNVPDMKEINPSSETFLQKCNVNCQNEWFLPKNSESNMLETIKKCDNDRNFSADVVELNTNSLQTSKETSRVNLETRSSQLKELKITNMNDSKKTTGDNLIILDDKKKECQNEINADSAEFLSMDVECEVATINKLEDNSSNLIEDVILNGFKINECENANLNVEKALAEKNLDTYRCESDSWSDDDDSSSTSSDTSSDSNFFQMVLESSSAPKTLPEIKTRGELGLNDLPPIEDLTITIPEEDMMLIGKIHAVVDKLVVIHAAKDLKPLDIDSILFLTHEKALGRIYDVFGPVIEPFYCVRFNSIDQIKEKDIEIGADVFFAPEKEEITSYVFVDELQKEKGSDASWKFNNEPPEECLDFSDDEQEKEARRKRMAINRNRQFSSSLEVSAKKPPLITLNDNSTSATCPPPAPRSNINMPTISRSVLLSSPYSSHLPSSPAPSTIAPHRFIPFSSSNPSHPPPSPSLSVFPAPRFSPFSSPYPSHPPPSPSVITDQRFTPFSSSYLSHPPPTLSVFAAPRFNPFSSPYPSHPSPSPPVFVASRFNTFSNPYPSHPPPSPSPSISSVFATPNVSPISNSYPHPPLSPALSVCSVMSVAVRARTQNPMNYSAQKQPSTPFIQQPRAFSTQNALQRSTVSSSSMQNHTFRTPSPQQPRQQSVLQRSFTPQSAIQRPLLPPQNIMQKPVLPPPSYQHVFGQVSLMSPLQSTLPPPPRMQSFVPPQINPQNPLPYNNLNIPSYSPVPSHHPLTVEIPNNPVIPLHFPPQNTMLPVLNNMIGNGQPPLF